MNVPRMSCLGAVLATALTLHAGAGAQTTSAPPARDGASAARATVGLDRSDRKFVEEAAHGGMAEVELGRLAQQRAADSQVKAFGERMVVDHGKANDELMQLVSARGLQLPEPDRGHMKDAERLGKLSGSKFDMAYMKHMLDDHKKDVAAFQKASRSAKDPEIRAFAAKTLPTLQAHLLQAQTTYDTIRKQPAPNVAPTAQR